MSLEIVAKKDYDGYFQHFVQGLVDRKEAEGGTFRHRAIEITAGPYRPYAVSYESKDGVLHLDFYAALRAGFGGISSQEIEQLVSLL